MTYHDSPGRSPHWIELKIASHPANLAAARHAAEAFARSCGFGETSRGEIGLCVNEALANVHRHAYGGATNRPINIRLECLPDAMRITIRDWGTGADPRAFISTQRDPLKPGGLGLVCLREWMDEIMFEPQSDGMMLTMVRQKMPGVSERRRVG